MQQTQPPLQFVRRIAIDDRERGSGVIEALRDHPDVDLTVRRLERGDYLIDRTLVVERKTLPDFAMSVVDGRLFAQAIGAVVVDDDPGALAAELQRDGPADPRSRSGDHRDLSQQPVHSDLHDKPTSRSSLA